MIYAEHLGSHSTYTIDKNLEEVRFMVLKDRRVATAEMPQTVNVSDWSVYSIMCDNFGFHKSSTRWVPRQLTDWRANDRQSSGNNFSCFQETEIVAFSMKGHADGVLGFPRPYL